MKVKRDNLVRFLELLALKGEIENKEVLLNIEKNRITTKLVFSRTVIICGELKGEYDTIGKVGIDNIQLLLSLLKTYPDNELNLNKKDNKFVFSDNDNLLTISLVLREPDYILNTIEDTKVKELFEKAQGNEFTLPIGVIKQIVKYTNAIGSEHILLKGNDKELSVTLVNNENNILAKFPIEQSIKPFKVKLAKFLLAILNITNKELIVSIKNDSPISLKLTTDDYTITYIVAPLKQE